MLPKSHFFLGGIFALLIAYIYNLSIIPALIIFAASFLMDADHYIYYVYLKKDLNLFNSISFLKKSRKKYFKLQLAEKKKINRGFYVFHGIEFILIFSLLGFFLSFYFYYIAIGFAFHLFLDFIDEFRHGWKWERISIIYDYFKRRNLKKIF